MGKKRKRAMEQLREVEGVSAALTKQMKHIPHRILLTSLISLQIVSLDEANYTCGSAGGAQVCFVIHYVLWFETALIQLAWRLLQETKY